MSPHFLYRNLRCIIKSDFSNFLVQVIPHYRNWGATAAGAEPFGDAPRSIFIQEMISTKHALQIGAHCNANALYVPDGNS
jgi:hypothetical protein